MASGPSIGKLLGDSRELRAELSVQLPEDHPCPLTDACPSVTEIEKESAGGECHLITKRSPTNGDDGAVRYVKSDVEEACFCNAFTENDTAAVIADRTDDDLVIETYPPGRVSLINLVEQLSDIADVEVTQLSLVSGEDKLNQLETVNVSLLTELERETVEWAIEQGYYERPREVELSDIADEFGVTESTISQRLRSAERKLVVDAMDTNC